MFQDLLNYAPLISAGMAGLTALIWVVYLTAFLASYRRQRRPSILITSAAGRGMGAHCFVTNLGLEPLYVLDIILDLTRPDGTRIRAVIPERNEQLPNDDQPGPDDGRGATNVGPLCSGVQIDLGRFKTMIDRACAENAEVQPDMPLSALEITVVTITAAGAELCAASRAYRVEEKGGALRLYATSIKAKQIQSVVARRRLARELEQRLGARL